MLRRTRPPLPPLLDEHLNRSGDDRRPSDRPDHVGEDPLGFELVGRRIRNGVRAEHEQEQGCSRRCCACSGCERAPWNARPSGSSATERRTRAARSQEERAHIARELHDVVAHSVSVMIVQTGVVRRRIAGDRPQEGDLLEEVEQTGRQAMAEMRRLLGLLRSDDDGIALTPQPGIASLPALVEQLREAGLPVELRIDGDERSLPPGVDVAAYRIAQEALTNALRHGGGAPTRVQVGYGSRRLELAVDDDGPGSAAPDDGRGHGLVGMRERVALYGGRFEAGRRPEGGFSVRATLALEVDER